MNGMQAKNIQVQICSFYLLAHEHNNNNNNNKKNMEKYIYIPRRREKEKKPICASMITNNDT